MSEQDGGSLVYQVDIETAKMITGSRKASIVLEEMQRQTGKPRSLSMPYHPLRIRLAIQWVV